MSVLKCKPWGEGQGDFVLVDEDSFDPTFHKLSDPPDREAPHKPPGGKRDPRTRGDEPPHATTED